MKPKSKQQQKQQQQEAASLHGAWPDCSGDRFRSIEVALLEITSSTSAFLVWRVGRKIVVSLPPPSPQVINPSSRCSIEAKACKELPLDRYPVADPRCLRSGKQNHGNALNYFNPTLSQALLPPRLNAGSNTCLKTPFRCGHQAQLS